MKSIEERADARLDHLAFVAWKTATLSRAKKIPDLKKILTDLKKGRGKPVQTMAQQIAVARMWSALGYGKIKKAD